MEMVTTTKVVKLTPLQSLLVSLLIIGVGGALTYFWGLPMAQNALKSKSWPSVDGVITVSNFSSHTSDNSTTYGADIAYDYTIEGIKYTGNKATFGDYSSSDPSHARGIVNRYPVGQIVKVYYDPVSPQTSVLEPGATWSSFMVGGIGGLFVLIGLFALASSLKKITNKTPESQSPAAPTFS